MSVYDRAHDLAKALSNSPEYKEFKKCKEEAETSEENKKILSDILQKKYELQMAQLMGQEPDEEKVKQFEALFDIVKLNPIVGAYLNAEYRFQVMMTDVQKIIADSVGLAEEMEGFKNNVN